MTDILEHSDDCSDLDKEARGFITRKTHEIHGLMRRTAEEIITIGENLLMVQQRLPEMKFSAWLRAKFDFSRQNIVKLTEQRDTLSKRVSELHEEGMVGASEPIEVVNERRVRINWYRITCEFQRSIRSAQFRQCLEKGSAIELTEAMYETFGHAPCDNLEMTGTDFGLSETCSSGRDYEPHSIRQSERSHAAPQIRGK